MGGSTVNIRSSSGGDSGKFPNLMEHIWEMFVRTLNSSELREKFGKNRLFMFMTHQNNGRVIHFIDHDNLSNKQKNKKACFYLTNHKGRTKDKNLTKKALDKYITKRVTKGGFWFKGEKEKFTEAQTAFLRDAIPLFTRRRLIDRLSEAQLNGSA